MVLSDNTHLTPTLSRCSALDNAGPAQMAGFDWLLDQAFGKPGSAVANGKTPSASNTSGKISPSSQTNSLTPSTFNTTSLVDDTHTLSTLPKFKIQKQIKMPRQSRPTARPAPARPTVPARSAPAPTQQQQTRPATTYAPAAAAPPPAATAAPAAPTSQGPGLLGQMASTAA